MKNQNKKQHKAENEKRRNTWEIKPVTRVSKNVKRYDRKRMKNDLRKELCQ